MTDPTALAPEFIALQRALAGRYSLERELGRGGMGVVLLAREVALDRPVAIKLLPPAMAAQPARRARFLREAQTAAKLSHPNIVPIYAVDEVEGFVFFVMAYVEGETLGRRLQTRGPLNPGDGTRLIQEVAWALAYAHLRGIVHRDVKPDNILLERGSGRALVTDFGIARLTDNSGGTAVDEVLGTAQYMSPEQACGEAVDGRSDLYALGVVAFYSLSGRLPFDAPDVQAQLAMHITRPAPPLAAFAPGVPGKLAQAVDRCLAKDPAARFQTGEALAEAVAASTAVAHETPTPVRLWLQRGESGRMLIDVWTGVGVFTVVTALAGGRPPGLVSLAVMFGPAVAYALYRLLYTQRVLAAGYALEDIRLALRARAQQEREELVFEAAAEPPLLAKIARKLTVGAFGAAAGSGLLLAVLPWNPSWFSNPWLTGLWATFGISTLATFTGALIGRAIPGRRIEPRDPMKSLRLRAWSGRLGEWITRLASFGMHRTALPPAAGHRPTEIAIGLAVDGLFASLPKTTRRKLNDLLAVVRRLEADAQGLRARVDELNALMAGAGDDSAGARSTTLRDAGSGQAEAVSGARRALRADLAAERDAAARRLASSVAALENIRLDLLRLSAGAGTVDQLSADLTAARRIEADVDAALAGHREVEALLAPGTQPPAPERDG